MDKLLEIIFTTGRDPFNDLWQRLDENLLFFTYLLEELATFPFKEREWEVMSLGKGHDWEPPTPHHELTFKDGWLYLEEEKLLKLNPFPVLGSQYTVWVSEDQGLRDLLGYDTSLLNLAYAQIAEAETPSGRVGWVLGRRRLPSSLLPAIAAFRGGAVVEGKPYFHPSQLINEEVIEKWGHPEGRLILLLLREAYGYAKHLLLNEGRSQPLFYINPFERVEGKTLLEWALEGEQVVAPSSQGWTLEEEPGPGRVKLFVEEEAYITLYQQFGARKTPFLLRHRNFVRHKVGKTYVFAKVEDF